MVRNVHTAHWSIDWSQSEVKCIIFEGGDRKLHHADNCLTKMQKYSIWKDKLFDYTLVNIGDN